MHVKQTQKNTIIGDWFTNFKFEILIGVMTEFLQAMRENYVRQSVLHLQKPFTHNQTRWNRITKEGSVVTNSCEMPRKWERCNSDKLRLVGTKNKSHYKIFFFDINLWLFMITPLLSFSKRWINKTTFFHPMTVLEWHILYKKLYLQQINILKFMSLCKSQLYFVCLFVEPTKRVIKIKLLADMPHTSMKMWFISKVWFRNLLVEMKFPPCSII